MKPVLIFLCIFLSLLQARENPFKPVIDDTVLPIASNEVKKAPPFRSTKIKLPNDARVLTSVAIYYQSIDGSIKKETISIDRTIDWHKPILITQQQLKQQTSSSAKEKRVKKTFKPFKFLKIAIYDRRVDIVTKDKKIRSFHLNNPFKVALDLKRDARFLTKHIPLDTPPFVSVDVGNHNGYYRVVVTMDAPYRYKIVRRENGYSILLP